MTSKNTDPARAAESNLGYLIGVTATIHIFALTFVGMRTYTRIVVVRAFGTDDALMLASAICVFLGGMVTYILAAQHGLGRHTDTIDKKDHHEYLKLTFIQAIVSTIGGMAFLKLSVGFALLRFGTPPVYTKMLWSLIAFVCLYTLISWAEWAVVCKPIAGFWNKDLKPTCLPVHVHKGFALMNTSCNIFTDICFATIPIPNIQGLQMKRKTRIYLICVLSLGYVAVTLGIIKTIYQNTKRGDPDQSFTNDIQFWGFIQINVGIIAACAPALRPLVGGLLQLTSTGEESKTSRSRIRGMGHTGRSRGRDGGARSDKGKGWVRTESEIELELDGVDEAGSFSS